METGRNKKLIGDIFIYGIGNLGYKVITFLIFPLYTFFVEKENLGYYDIALTTVFFLIPFFNLQLRDSVFRFLIEEKDENRRKEIITQSYRIVIRITLIATLLSVAVMSFVHIRCGYYILGLLLTMGFYELQMQIVRGLGQTKLFAASGVLTAFMILTLSLVFVVWLKWDIQGIFLSNILARILTMIFLEFKMSLIYRYFSLKKPDRNISGMLLKYSLPLIASASFLWTVGNMSRYFIGYYLGYGANGLFAVALKFSVIVELIATIVFQAWQETSVLQFKSKDRDRYYSSVLSAYLVFLSGLTVFLGIALKTFYPMLVDGGYEDGLAYLYVLLTGGIAYALQAFMSAIFLASKNTKHTLFAALTAFIAGLILNYIFIKRWELMGIAIAYGLSYFVMFVYYLIYARKSVKIMFSPRSLIVSLLMLAAGGFVFYSSATVFIRIALLLACLVALCFSVPESVREKVKNLAAAKFTNIKNTSP